MPTRWPPRIIYNDDTCTLRTAPQPHTVESVAHALDYLKGTQADCLCWCVGEQIAYAWPSEVIENIFELKERGGRLFAGWENDRDVMYTLYKQGIDYLPLLIARAQAGVDVRRQLPDERHSSQVNSQRCVGAGVLENAPALTPLGRH